MNAVEERRRHRRHTVQSSVRCRRLGRGGYEEEVASVDLSLGGVLVRADDRLGVGDVLVLDFPVADLSLGLRGLVVSVRSVAGDPDPDARYVHVAFTGLSPERLDLLCRYVEDLSAETSA